MITLDTVIQQLHIWDGQILLFNHESWQHGNRMDRVIHCSAVSQKDQTCGTPFSAGIIGFPLRDELPAEELCGTGPSL